MKQAYPDKKLARLCWLFGVSRQAYYQQGWRIKEQRLQHEVILQRIKLIREQQPQVGTRKLYRMLQDDFREHHIKMGRDTLFNLMAEHNLLIRRRSRKKPVTTQSQHWYRKYSNLIKQLQVTRPNQLWVSDITYLRTQSGFVYLSLITDAYSKKIMGYHVADNLEAVNTLEALKMALAINDKPLTGLIHHSDRGIQYCSLEYITLLNSNNIRISMTENGDPRENAIAERVNGILKHEFLLQHPIKNKIEAEKFLANVVKIYNQHRLHYSCSLLTPHQVHQYDLPVNKLWKNYKRNKPEVNLFQD